MGKCFVNHKSFYKGGLLIYLKIFFNFNTLIKNLIVPIQFYFELI